MRNLRVPARGLESVVIVGGVKVKRLGFGSLGFRIGPPNCWT